MGLRSRAGKIKIAGSILCVAGALTISLYKGKTFHIFHSHHTFKQQANIVKTKGNWTRGTFMLVGSCLGYATWYILQVKLFKVFPSRYWATMITCVIASLQSAVIGVLLNRSEDAWKLRWNLQFVTIVYSGALATAATFCLILWTIKSRGPTYPSMFNPLSLIFVAISESLFLGEAISVGSLLGMVMIVVGLYAFLWGKRNEPPTLPTPNITEANTEAVPQSTGLELPLPLPSISHCHNKSIEKNAL
ncbi:hypothetical protein HHK36_029294 [Tetracentron sinense]|uniref:WAT1-related protein n=1 Tax=Tetracentron sinense TaxID=13715 RepID=A0A834YIX4_TETSI|nr:hypothetical protein HHK36_029294 [Tetracentron sinense]